MRLDLAVRQAAQRIASGARGEARRDAETLLMHILGRDRAYLYARPELELAGGELTRYHEATERRARGEPLQYITGHQEFWELDFLVNPAVLIPRPETEHAVEAALELVGNVPHPHIVDVGTGSGCIALALASELPQAKLEAVDISADALAVARKNAQRLGLADRVTFSQGDLLEKHLAAGPVFDLVVSNPPYVGEGEAENLPIEVRKHEPHGALFGGVEGLDIYRRLIPQAQTILKAGGGLVLEIGYTQSEQVRELLSQWQDVRSVPDLRGIPRVMLARCP